MKMVMCFIASRPVTNADVIERSFLAMFDDVIKGSDDVTNITETRMHYLSVLNAIGMQLLQ